MQINIHEAKTHFSQIVDRALAGEEVIIAKNGKPLLTLQPIAGKKSHRTPGLSLGKGKNTRIRIFFGRAGQSAQRISLDIQSHDETLLFLPYFLTF